jgi:hypothetical protein
MRRRLSGSHGTLAETPKGMPEGESTARSTVPDSTDERRVRRMAARQGLRVEKSHLRDPRAIGFGTWQLVDGSGALVAGDHERGYGLTLTQVEDWLTR